jgi:imidazolonepropionase-like amidohydrolase
VLYIAKLGVFTNLEILKMWCEDTPRSIFPRRRIGHVRKGYEASFLALDGDPLEDIIRTKNIRLRFKQGHLINLAEKK